MDHWNRRSQWRIKKDRKRPTRCERNLQRGSQDRGVVSVVAEEGQRAGDRLL